MLFRCAPELWAPGRACRHGSELEHQCVECAGLARSFFRGRDALRLGTTDAVRELSVRYPRPLGARLGPSADPGSPGIRFSTSGRAQDRARLLQWCDAAFSRAWFFVMWGARCKAHSTGGRTWGLAQRSSSERLTERLQGAPGSIWVDKRSCTPAFDVMKEGQAGPATPIRCNPRHRVRAQRALHSLAGCVPALLPWVARADGMGDVDDPCRMTAEGFKGPRSASEGQRLGYKGPCHSRAAGRQHCLAEARRAGECGFSTANASRDPALR